MQRKIIFIFFLGYWLFFLNACKYFNQEEGSIYEEDFVVKVNSSVIDLDTFQKKLNYFVTFFELPYQKENFDKNKIHRIVVEQVIEEQLVIEEINRLGISISEEILLAQNAFSPLEEYDFEYLIKQKELSKEDWINIHNFFLIKRKLIDSYLLPNIQITEKEIQNYYSKNKNKFTFPRRYEVSHIQVDSLDIAKFLEAQIKKDVLFTNLVREYSVATDKIFEGNLGLIEKSTLPKIFDEAIFKLTLKDPISPIIQSKLGYHIFKLNRILNKSYLSEQEARVQIVKALRLGRLDSVYYDWLNSIKQKSTIIINEQLLSNQEGII